MIRLKDYAIELDRLTRLGRFEDAQAEFDGICQAVFGACLDDLFSDECERLGEMVNAPGAAIFLCRVYGFDLSSSGKEAVPGWRGFALLILAKAEGLIPTARTLRRERRLAIHAENLLDVHSRQW
jgi:hypothetical protein